MAHAYIEFVIDEFPPGFVLGINKYKDKQCYRYDSYTKQRTYTMIEMFWDKNADPGFSEKWVTAFASNCEITLEKFALAMENIAPSEVTEEFDRSCWSPSSSVFVR